MGEFDEFDDVVKFARQLMALVGEADAHQKLTILRIASDVVIAKMHAPKKIDAE